MKIQKFVFAGAMLFLGAQAHADREIWPGQEDSAGFSTQPDQTAAEAGSHFGEGQGRDPVASAIKSEIYARRTYVRPVIEQSLVESQKNIEKAKNKTNVIKGIRAGAVVVGPMAFLAGLGLAVSASSMAMSVAAGILMPAGLIIAMSFFVWSVAIRDSRRDEVNAIAEYNQIAQDHNANEDQIKALKNELGS